MKKQAFNPYLPLNVYIPDGEPHIFGDRVYVYGSHDEEGGDSYCKEPYCVWSAPLDDLSDWSCRGISYRAEQDPHATPERHHMYAPDVVRGNDGRFYMYYCLSGQQAKGCYWGPISVAVCDTPDGEFSYYGDVRNPDGSIFDRYIAFDPAVMNDDGVIRLYYGTMMPYDDYMDESNRDELYGYQQRDYRKSMEEIAAGVMGPATVTLADDMLTVTSEAVRLAPSRSVGTPWEGHGFFEASSIRKIGDTYYFIYSSHKHHELCYATSRYPDRDFTFRGVIISNGDIGYRGRQERDRLNRTGNNHGSLVNIRGQWYIFYHRMTHDADFSRQGCAEPISILPDGSIPQVEMTSCGLNGGPLVGEGLYPASICCNLTNGHMPHTTLGDHYFVVPQITHGDRGQYIKNLREGTWVGYKYIAFDGVTDIAATYRSAGRVKLSVYTAMDGERLGEIELIPTVDWKTVTLSVSIPKIVAPLFFRFDGDGCADLLEFELIKGA